jgi:MIP family channel proteins
MSVDKYVAEALGTFVLVLVGVGAVLVNVSTNNGIGILGIAFAFGGALAGVLYAFSHVSGGHMNPAVTIAMWATRRIKSAQALGYIIAQLVGAAIAAGVLSGIFTFSPPTAYLGTPQLANLVTPTIGVVVEALLTGMLVLVIFGTVVDKRGAEHMAPAAIGAALFIGHIFGLALTGSAMNPARAFGPALVSGYWLNQAVYWVGPIVGALVAAFIYEHILLGKKLEPTSRGRK